jgi:hypothetical protein
MYFVFLWRKETKQDRVLGVKSSHKNKIQSSLYAENLLYLTLFLTIIEKEADKIE